MPRGKSFDEIVADAETLIRVWTENPDFNLGDVTLASLKTMFTTFKTTRANTDSLRTQLTKAVSDMNDQGGGISDICTRARSGARAQFGPNSTQYEQLGGTRASERKPRKKKADPGTPKS